MNLEAMFAQEWQGLDDALVRVAGLTPEPSFAPADGRVLLSAMVDAHLATGGKRLRGLLPAAMVRAGGGPVAAAWTFGACVELVHNGTLIHDDIQDGDALRRGKPTLWALHGAAQAINAGSALYAAPLTTLATDATLPEPLRGALCGLVGRALVDTIAGQVADLDLHGQIDHDRETLRAVAVAKTAPLFAAVVAGAALLLGEPIRDASFVTARSLGLAFQIRDDLLDLVGTKGRGAAGADLREGKLTLPIRYALDRAPADERAALTALLARAGGDDAVDDKEIAKWVQWVHDRGGVNEARDELATLINDATSAGRDALPAASAAVLQAFAARLGTLDG